MRTRRRTICCFLAVVTFLLLASVSCATGARESSGCRPEYEVPPRQGGVAYLDLMAAGDTGSGDDGQAAVAGAMKGYAQANPVELVLLLGDNFYEDGVSSTSDPQWLTKFEQMYDPGVLDMPFYAVLGNHDYFGNPAAQVDYTLQSSRWKMPARYYTFTHNLSDGTTVGFFAIDTNTIESEPAQLAWLDAALSASTARWKIVFGHHPAYSNGWHGDNAGLIAMLAPLLSARGADIYLAGHDHDLQVLRPVGGVLYLVDGAGSRLRDTGCQANTVYAASSLGFMGLRISRDELVTFVVLAGSSIDFCLVTSKP